MTWLSKTWTQVYTSETNCQNLADQVLKSITFLGSRLGMPSFEPLHCFANPCSQVLKMIVLFKTWYLKSWTFWGTKFHNVFHGLVFQDMNTSENNCQDLTDQVSTSNTFFVQDLGCQVLKCYIVLQIHVPKSWHWLHFSRLGVPSIEAFWGNQFQH